MTKTQTPKIPIAVYPMGMRKPLISFKDPQIIINKDHKDAPKLLRKLSRSDRNNALIIARQLLEGMKK